MCEWLKQAVLKTAERETVPGVRIPLPPPLLNDANAVRLAVRDVEDTGGTDVHAVRPRERASKGIGFGAIAALSGANHGGYDAGCELDSANDMVFRVSFATRAGPPSPE